MTLRTPASTLLALLLIAAIGACSSDDFTGVGGGLPTDVSQDADSVEVELPPVFPTQAVVITPLDTIPAVERPAMYLGERPQGNWRMTPLIQFDTNSSIVEENLPLGWADVQSVKLRISRMVQADDIAVERTARLYQLSSPLSEDDLLEPDVSALLGSELASALFSKGGDALFTLPTDSVKAWFDAGMHNGLAVLHEAPPAPEGVYSNFRGMVGLDFPSRSRADISTSDPLTGPELSFTLISDETNNFEIESVEAFTHVERDLPTGEDLQIGSWIERRVWMDFDLGPTLVPVDATINRCTLTLRVRPAPTMQVRGFSSLGSAELALDQQVRSWESTRDEAGDVSGVEEAWLNGGRELLSGKSEFNPDYATVDGTSPEELVLDVTEYVQRQVNEVGPNDLPPGTAIADIGLLLAFSSEQLDMCLGVFYGVDQPDSLKPRLDITYTPPTKTWE
jgi:hypothetical protein